VNLDDFYRSLDTLQNGNTWKPYFQIDQLRRALEPKGIHSLDISQLETVASRFEKRAAIRIFE
jgi:hypothetical protein